MERITTQKEIAKALKLSTSFLFYIIQGKQRPSSARALELERLSGIGRMQWLYGSAPELRREIERVFGKINVKRGRPKSKEVAK